MGAWLLISVIAVTVVTWRLIGVAGAIWRERARVTSHCTQMETSALSGATLCERLPDGTTLLVMPGPACPGQASADETISALREMTPL
jgi:hypothetical protein